MATVLYFGWARDCAGTSHEELPLNGSTTTEDFWNMLIERHPRLVECRSASRLAVNMEYVGNDAVIGDNAEVAIIPPVAGG